MLVLDAGSVVPSDRLVDELWRSQPPPGARKTLRSYISRLRGLLRPDATLTARGDGYVLELEHARVDAVQFEGLTEEGLAALSRGDARLAAERFGDGLALWGGRALADVIDVETLALESRRLEELRLVALEGRIEAQLELGLHAELVGELEGIVAEHPLRERFWRHLILTLYRCERQADALAAYRRARELLADELGLEPGEELRRLEQAVLRHEVAPSPRRPPTHNLPAPLTSFVGRRRELADLERLLGEARLLMLIGLGGVGKTRLALELAARVVDGYRDGVWFVDLSGIEDPSLAPHHVAAVIGLRESAGLPLLDVLRDHLRTTELLLILDNCEHLLPSCAELIETLLVGAPPLRILATSREAVGVTGGVEYAVEPLEVPPAAADPRETTSVDAVRLFLDRASARGGLAAIPTAVATVARICRDLDGIPLAIELAAARTRALSVDEIAAHLDDRFDFLKYWRRVAVPRHQTLRATMDWSYELLSDREKEVLRRLSVFAGGSTLRAAAAVCAAGDEARALDTIARLVERSMVVADLRGDETRYRLLETVRQYAAERLEEADEVDETRRAHALTFLSLAEQAPPADEDWFSRLVPEQDNLRIAIDWSLAAGEKIAPRLALASSRFWYAREHDEEARRWLERALEAHPQRDRLRAELLGLLGSLLYESADLQRADVLLSEGVRLARAHRNHALEARLIVRWALVRLHLPDVRWDEVLRECEQAVVVLESEGDLSGLAEAWVAIGKARLFIGDDADQEALERAVSYARQSGNRRTELVAVEFLAMTFLTLRIPADAAIEREEQLLAAAEDRYTEQTILGHLAQLYGWAGRFAEAREAIGRCRALYAESGASLWWASHAQITGSIELLAGDAIAAEGALRETYDALHGMGEVSYRSTTALWLAESLYEQGRYEEAEELADEAETTMLADDFIDHVHLHTIRAKLHARRGDIDEAVRLVEDANRITPASNAYLLGELLLTKGDVLLRAGKHTEAIAVLREALHLFERLRAPALAVQARTLLDELAVASARPG
jgi:predicted ATPase/DNA-binding SARP family transcriptional activator/predicted negative regulator of RcsB-dependent stress response